MRDLQETIELLRMRALQHYHATIQVDPCRIIGYFACASLANELDHIHKMDIQENIADRFISALDEHDMSFDDSKARAFINAYDKIIM